MKSVRELETKTAIMQRYHAHLATLIDQTRIVCEESEECIPDCPFENNLPTCRMHLLLGAMQ